MMRVDRPQPLDPGEEYLWRSLMRLVKAVPRVLEEDFAADSNLATSEYVVLMHLSEAPDQALRMSDLAIRTSLSPSRVSRVVDDLARAGLVFRTRCSSDGRGYEASLTSLGLQRLQAAYEPFLRRVRLRFFDGLSAADVAEAGRVLGLMLDTLERSLDPRGEVAGALSAGRAPAERNI
jgi:DNA-binding MarR family transcriptional regulator